ncbi:hypothetical protein DERF_012480 [Dermatophagoides farinae]|uniref:Uncharacterized protein n=1 Tax=Dermatophagoides farinae TaxID=6954 RepID=A0A922KYF1_DERFA|nr:hypothetical protein DERF_012480 [Dermatophagoides farinae]
MNFILRIYVDEEYELNIKNIRIKNLQNEPISRTRIQQVNHTKNKIYAQFTIINEKSHLKSGGKKMNKF